MGEREDVVFFFWCVEACLPSDYDSVYNKLPVYTQAGWLTTNYAIISQSVCAKVVWIGRHFIIIFNATHSIGIIRDRGVGLYIEASVVHPTPFNDTRVGRRC